MKNKFRAGFTLVEMLTVVIIIGILTSIALPQYRRAVQKAQVTEALQMLRVIKDSSERLAVSLGYRNFAAMWAAHDSRAVFERMDMFEKGAMRCTLNGATMTCRNFEYQLTDGPVVAIKRRNPHQDTTLRLYRGDIPRITCSNPEGSEVCDLYNLDEEASAEEKEEKEMTDEPMEEAMEADVEAEEAEGV